MDGRSIVNPAQSVGDILDRLAEVAARRDRVSVGDVVEAIGSRSYGPMLLAPPLIEFSPLGAVPGIPTFLAITIAIVALQMLIGHRHLWLPPFIRRRTVAGARVAAASDSLRGIARFMDRWFHGRAQALTHGLPVRLAALVILALCATVPPLELVPFASSGPMIAIAAFGLALLVRDGLLMMIALGVSLGAAGLGFSLFGGEYGTAAG